MGRWLARLATEEKNAETAETETFKTLKTQPDEVLKVLRVPEESEYEKTSSAECPPIKVRTASQMPAVPFEQRAVDWMPEPGPGITILRPAVEVEPAEYDAHLDTIIAALPDGSPERSRLTFAKRKGWCVERGGERIYVKGRT